MTIPYMEKMGSLEPALIQVTNSWEALFKRTLKEMVYSDG